MMRVFKTAIATATLLAGATGVQAVTNFQADVNAAIDAGLAYSRANNYFTTFNYGNGLSLLTLLEKATLPAGYAGLDTDDRTLARKAACLMIDDGNFGDHRQSAPVGCDHLGRRRRGGAGSRSAPARSGVDRVRIALARLFCGRGMARDDGAAVNCGSHRMQTRPSSSSRI